MEMTEFEIFKNWKESKNPSTQVKILADLNGCKPEEITAIIRKVETALEQTAEPVPAEPTPSADDLDKRLIELYNAGATYKGVADALPVSMNTIKTHVMKLTASGEIAYRRPRKNSKANTRETHEPEPERTKKAPATIPADDMIQWLDVLKACTDRVEGGAKITHICANDGAQAEVGFTADGKDYLIMVEVQRN